MNGPSRAVLKRAEDLDLRRQKQIGNQIESINRLLKGGTYDSEMAQLHEDLAKAQAKLSRLMDITQAVLQPGLNPELYQNDSKALNEMIGVLDER